MAIVRGISGFEAADSTGWTDNGNRNFLTTSPRSGNRYLQVVKTVAGTSCGLLGGLLARHRISLGAGDSYKFLMRGYMRVTAYPSATDHDMFGINRVGVGTQVACRMEMSTTGQIRLTHPVTSTAYTTEVLPTGQWLKVVCEFTGTNGPGGNYTATITVSTDTGAVVASRTTTQTEINALGTVGDVLIGQADFFGADATINVDYDDVVWYFASAADASSAALPTSTKIYPVLVTGQGAGNGFSPSGAYDRVDEVPRDAPAAGTSVTSGTVGSQSTYQHQTATQLQVTDIQALACSSNVSAAPQATHGLLLNGVRTDFTLGSTTDDAGAESPVVVDWANYSAAQFDAAEFGVEVVAAGSTVTLENIFAEILAEAALPAVGGGLPGEAKGEKAVVAPAEEGVEGMGVRLAQVRDSTTPMRAQVKLQILRYNSLLRGAHFGKRFSSWLFLY